MLQQRIASLDRAKAFLAHRIQHTRDEATCAQYQETLRAMETRRKSLEGQVPETVTRASLLEQARQTSLIEQALYGKHPTLISRLNHTLDATLTHQYPNWIAQAFRDPAFSIEPAEADGDCLFHVISMATNRPVMELKQQVANSATNEEFVTKKALYDSAVQEYPRTQNRLNQTPRTSPYFESLQRQLANYADDMSTYRWLNDIRTVAQYRNALATQGVWGDAEAIGHIENALNAKLLILSLKKNKSGTPEIYCNAMIPEGFHPSHYILVGYHDTQCHYDLVKYAGRRLFILEQLPFAVRRLFNRDCPNIHELGGWE